MHLVIKSFLLVCLQVINNACATQAIVSVLLNCSHPDVLLGDTLSEFREFSQSFDAAVRKLYFLIFLVACYKGVKTIHKVIRSKCFIITSSLNIYKYEVCLAVLQSILGKGFISRERLTSAAWIPPDVFPHSEFEFISSSDERFGPQQLRSDSTSSQRLCEVSCRSQGQVSILRASVWSAAEYI